jgi:hypothetical protein
MKKKTITVKFKSYNAVLHKDKFFIFNIIIKILIF